MTEPHDTRKTISASASPSANEPAAVSEAAMPKVASSAETDVLTYVQKTLSETGNEGAEIQSKSGAVGVGSRIGPYQLVRKLGQGGMGAVYEAQHTKLDKTFALKVLPPGFASNAAAVSRFEREMKAVGKLDHPNIIRATNADEFNGTHYLVMEYVEGIDLSVLVKSRGPMSLSDACDVIRQTALGLQHAHEHGLVHRDIKPSNLFVCSSAFRRSDGTAPPKGGTTNIKILDLGLARLGDDAPGGGLTSSGQVLGTPDYMAPEQWDDTHSVDARADLYSLGCTLFFVLTGKAPFAEEGSKPSLMRLMRAHTEASIPDLLAVRPDVPAELNSIFQRLLAKKPEDRFQTAAAVATALEPFIQSSPVAPRQESRTSPEAILATNSQSTTDITRESGSPVAERQGYVDTPTTSIITPRPASRGTSTTRQRVLAVVVLACVVLAGVVIAITQKNGTNERRMAAPGRPSDADPDTKKTAEGGHPPKATGWHGWPADAPPPAIAPFDAEQAQQHQEAWAKYLGVPVEYTNTIGMKFRLIPPGEFTMGSTPEEIDEAIRSASNQHWSDCIQSEGPRHKVILTQPIYIGVHEVTQTKYEKVVGQNPSHFAPMGAGKAAVIGMDTTNHPVEMVSWNDAAEFCAKLSQQEKLKPFYFRAGETVTPLDGTGYRLSTEAEWELACRAGTTTKFWIDDNEKSLAVVGWFATNSGQRTHVVAELKANPFGLYDVHGNTEEWINDWWEPTYYSQFQEQAAINPNGPSSVGSYRVFRGGGWGDTGLGCRSTDRDGGDPAGRIEHIGFRVALPVDAVRQALKVTGTAMPKPVATTPSARSSDTEKLPAKFTNRLGMEFVLVGKGTAWLGGGNGQQGEKKVEMPEDFYLGRYEVTQAEWEQVTGQTPSHFSRTGGGQDAVKDIPDADLKRFPVEQVSWDDAQLFLERLNKQEPSAGWVYRLPKADEWEYACRGGPLSDKLDSAFDFYVDKPMNLLRPDQANFLPESGKSLQRTCKVGSYQPNRLGLYDMHGNVFEWCDETKTAADGASHRVYRGGSWTGDSGSNSTAHLATHLPSNRHGDVGLRLARVPVGPAKPKPVATTPSAPASK